MAISFLDICITSSFFFLSEPHPIICTMHTTCPLDTPIHLPPTDADAGISPPSMSGSLTSIQSSAKNTTVHATFPPLLSTAVFLSNHAANTGSSVGLHRTCSSANQTNEHLFVPSAITSTECKLYYCMTLYDKDSNEA